MAGVEYSRNYNGFRVIILEDNPAHAYLILNKLKEAGFLFTPRFVESERTYKQALQKFQPDLILSDYGLPGYNGILALDEAKRRCPNVPFIFVTTALPEDRALEVVTSGARDCVLKNKLDRLPAAVRRALWESEGNRVRNLVVVDIRLDRSSRTAYIRNNPINLSILEFDLLEKLLTNAGKIVSRDELANGTLCHPLPAYGRSIDVHISKLRKKLGRHGSGLERIKSVRGTGYVYL